MLGRLFPRPRGRGLIEASPPSPAPPTSGCYFRDRVVAASLKQRSARPAEQGRAAFPRPRGRGLIEAFFATPSLTHRRYFRDRVVAASLKPGALALAHG